MARNQFARRMRSSFPRGRAYSRSNAPECGIGVLFDVPIFLRAKGKKTADKSDGIIVFPRLFVYFGFAV